MSEPERKNCKECGGEILRWPDIAGAMESMLDLPNIQPGLIPMMRQAIDEIRDLRKQAVSVNGPQPYFPYPMTYTFRDENCDDLYRDAMRYRRIRVNWVTVKELNIDGRTAAVDSAVDYWLGQK